MLVSSDSAQVTRRKIQPVGAPAAPSSPESLSGSGSAQVTSTALSPMQQSGVGQTPAQAVQAQQGAAQIQAPAQQAPQQAAPTTVNWNLVKGLAAPTPRYTGPTAAPAPRPGTTGTPGYAAPGAYDQGAQNSPNVFSTPQDFRTTPWPTWGNLPQQAEHQRWALGPLANVLMGDTENPLRQADIPLLEARLNFENLLLAEQDRERAYNELVRARGAVGTSPEMQAVKAYLQQNMADGPFGEPFLSGQRSALQAGASADYDRAIAEAQQSAAQRGMGGGMTPYEAAMLKQASARGLAGQMGEMERTYGVANQQAQQQAGLAFQQQAQLEAEQRAALDELISKLFSETERGAIDLSGLLNRPATPDYYVGG